MTPFSVNTIREGITMASRKNWLMEKLATQNRVERKIFVFSFNTRTSVRSRSNFRTRHFGQFAKIKILTPKKKIAQSFFREKCFSAFSADFGGARLDLTSESDSSRYLASDGQIFRSIRRLEPFFFLCFLVCASLSTHNP